MANSKKKSEEMLQSIIPSTATAKLLNNSKVADDIRDKMIAVGDITFAEYFKTGDLKNATTSISAYKVALKCAQTQLIYQRMTGKATDVEFLNSSNDE